MYLFSIYQNHKIVCIHSLSIYIILTSCFIPTSVSFLSPFACHIYLSHLFDIDMMVHTHSNVLLFIFKSYITFQSTYLFNFSFSTCFTDINIYMYILNVTSLHCSCVQSCSSLQLCTIYLLHCNCVQSISNMYIFIYKIPFTLSAAIKFCWQRLRLS